MWGETIHKTIQNHRTQNRAKLTKQNKRINLKNTTIDYNITKSKRYKANSNETKHINTTHVQSSCNIIGDFSNVLGNRVTLSV